MTRYAAGDIASEQGEPPVTLVTLSAPGFIVRAASEPIEIGDDGAGPYLYDSRLVQSITFDRELDVFSVERTRINRARVSVVLPEDLGGASSLEAAGHHLAASRCEVALIWPGQKFGQRDILIGGATISGLRMGVSGEPVQFVAEALPPATGAPIGDAGRLIPTVTLGFTPLRGKQYPTIIGRCYRLPGFKGLTGLTLAGHHFATPTVTDMYEDGSETPYVSWGANTFSNTTDSDGGDIAAITAGTNGTYTDFSVETYSSGAPRGNGSFTFDAANGGVRAASGSQDPAVGADGVVEWILAQSGERVDFARNRRALQLLRGLEIGVYVDREVDALACLRDRVLRHLPLVEEQGPAGLWLRYTDIQTQPAVVDLIEGVNLIGRMGGMEQVSDPDDIANRFVIRYAYDHALSDYTRSYTVDASNHPLCAISQQLYGVRKAQTIECNITWDDATAAFMLFSRASRLAMPRFATTWIADPSLYWLEEGSVARLTSPTLGVTSRKVAVRTVRATRDPLVVTLEMVPGTMTAGVL